MDTLTPAQVASVIREHSRAVNIRAEVVLEMVAEGRLVPVERGGGVILLPKKPQEARHDRDMIDVPGNGEVFNSPNGL